jgi:hypothetical protein
MKRLITLVSGAVLAASAYAQAPAKSAPAQDHPDTSASSSTTAKKAHKKHKKSAKPKPATETAPHASPAKK